MNITKRQYNAICKKYLNKPSLITSLSYLKDGYVTVNGKCNFSDKNDLIAFLDMKINEN